MHTLTQTGSVHPQPTYPAAVIDVAGLVKTYGTTRVVDDVSFTVHEGEIFGLLGANGAGKTTTVECLQGLREPDAGHLRILGLDPVRERTRLRDLIGSQLQDSALPDRLRVHEAVRLFDRLPRRSRDTVLEQWGLAETARTSFGDLSGGQRQRLFIVLALLNHPRVVFLDELTQGLDPSARREVWQVIRQIREEGTTVVLVSHFADEVEALCDRIAVMRHGRIIDTGTPREVTDRHAHTTTVTFTKPEGMRVEGLQHLPGVEGVDRVAGQIRVSGTEQMIAPVCAATVADSDVGPSDLRVDHTTLNDALVNLIGTQS